MWLVLCSAQDISGLWAFQGLQLRGLRPIELVTAEVLPYSLKWEHTLGASDPSISVTLMDGRVIKSGAVRGVLNRLTHVPLQHLAGAPDYDYAVQEYTAFFMSWLFALPKPIINRADAQGLCGAWRHISEWVWLAGRAGLPTAHYRQRSTDQIDETVEMRRLHPYGTPTVGAVVVGERVIGPSFSPEIRAGCLRLAELSKTALLGIEFAASASENGWTFAGATPMPDLRIGGEPLLNALAKELYQSS
jgi:hypothetical protein